MSIALILLLDIMNMEKLESDDDKDFLEIVFIEMFILLCMKFVLFFFIACQNIQRLFQEILIVTVRNHSSVAAKKRIRSN